MEAWAKTTNNEVTTQGSDAWKKWRGSGIGSSDAAVLLGWSPWKTIDELYLEKRGLWKQEFGYAQQSAMDRGKSLEPEIRAWYEKKEGLLFPDGIAEHPEYPFMRASFDGINYEAKRIIEIKAPNAKDHEEAKQGVVPQKYIAQCQWLMMVGGVDRCDYVSCGSDNTYAVVVVQKDAHIQSQLMLRAKIFWQHVNDKEEIFVNSPLHTKFVLPNHPPTGDELETIASQALKLQFEIKEKTAQLDLLKDKLKTSLGEDKEKDLGEVVIGWQTRKGAIDYKKIPVLQGLDLEPYRGEPVKAFFIKKVE